MTANQLVTLTVAHAGFPPGAAGRIVGFYRRPSGEVAVVSFAGRVAPVPVQLLEERMPQGA